MESVKQRINELTSTGIVSLRGEFELACLCQLVAVTEQRDALVAESPVLIDLARKFADRADDYKGSLMGFSVFESFNELKSAGSKEATSSAIAALRAEGVDMAVSHLIEKFNGTGIGVPVMALEHLARQLRESKGANHE